MQDNNYKSLIIVSIILGIFISIQLRVISIENNGTTTSKKGEQLTLELKALKKEEEKLKVEIDEIKESINQYKDNDDEDGKDSILTEIAKYEVLAGYTDVAGKGIEIKIKTDNSPVGDEIGKSIAYNYDLLLSLINKLNSAQANAIAINGERVVANTYFHLKSDSLYINDTKISEPFIIKAIGDPDTLASALQIKYGIVWELEKYYSASVEIEKKDDVKINRHSKKTEYEHSIINE